MKLAKKFLSIFVATVFLVQSFAFTPVIAKAGDYPVDGIDNYTWNSKMTATGTGNGVNGVSCYDNGSELKWTVSLSDATFYLESSWGKRPGINLAFDSSIIKSAEYVGSFNNYQYKVSLPGKMEKNILIPYENRVIKKLNVEMKNQQLVFKTAKDVDDFSFNLSFYAYHPGTDNKAKLENTITVNVTKNEPVVPPENTPLKIKVTGDVPNKNIFFKVGSNSLSNNLYASTDNTFSVPDGLADGTYTASFTNPDGYTLSPTNFRIKVENKQILNADTNTPYSNNTLVINSIKDADPVTPTPIPVSPVEYVEDEHGKYPKDYTNPDRDKNIRNVNTETVKNNMCKDDNHKIGYDDSTVGKWATPTDKDNEFFINLSVKGKQYEKPKGLDVVFVLDNSYSMVQNFNNERNNISIPYQDTKIWSLYKNVANISNELLKDPKKDIRIGVVNFSTLSVPYIKSDYNPVTHSGRHEYQQLNPAVKNFYKGNRNFSESDYSKAMSIFYDSLGAELKSPSIIDHYYLNGNPLYLTKNLEDVLYSLPTIPRGKHDIKVTGGFPEKVLNGQNFGLNHDGETNIAAGISTGAEILYNDSDSSHDRNKVMILVTDGMPTASFKLNNLNMDANKSFISNLDKSGTIGLGLAAGLDNYPKVRDNQAQALINTNTLAFNNDKYFEKAMAIYNTPDGNQSVFNNLQGTDAVRNYYVKKHPDMRIVGLLIGAENNFGVEFGEGMEIGKNCYPYNYTDSSLPYNYPYPGQYLKSLTTSGGNNYYTAATADALEKSLENIQNDIIKTVNDGTVTDPMGEDIILVSGENGAFNPAGKPTDKKKALSDGGYYLSNNLGQYLDADGKVHDASGTLLPDSVPSTLRGVTVTKETVTSKDGKTYDQIRIGSITLGENEEITLKYRVKLDKESSNFKYDYFYQANQPTTLVPTPGGEGRAFPIPSVMSPAQLGERSFIKQDKDNQNPLDGAEFAVYKMSGNKKQYLTEKDGKYSWASEQKDIKSIENLKIIKSDKNGKLSIGKIDYGEYYLVELIPPRGYELSSDPIKFTISDKSSGEKPQVVVNKKLPAFPFMGAGGNMWIYLAGAMILIMAMLLSMKLKRKNASRL